MTYKAEKRHDRNHAVSRKQYTVLLDRPFWFSLLGEESQRQFLQAIHEYDPASTVEPDQIGSHMAYGKDKQLRYVSWLVWTQTFGQDGFPVRVDFQKYISGAEDFYIKRADSHMV